LSHSHFINPYPSALLEMKKWLLKKPQGSSKGWAPDPDGVPVANSADFGHQTPADFRQKFTFFTFQNKVRADIFSGSLAVFIQKGLIAGWGGRNSSPRPSLPSLFELRQAGFRPPSNSVLIFSYPRYQEESVRETRLPLTRV